MCALQTHEKNREKLFLRTNGKECVVRLFVVTLPFIFFFPACIVHLLFHAATSNVVVVAATTCTTNIRSKCMLAFSMFVRKFTQSSFDQASVPFILARWHFLQDRLAIFIHFSDEFFFHLSYHLTRIS